MHVTQKQLHQRFTAAFVVLCMGAIGIQIAGLAVPKWYEARRLFVYDVDNPSDTILVYQGLFSDYWCKIDNSTDCVVTWHVDYSDMDKFAVLPKIKTLRSLELAALSAGAVSFVGLLSLMCTYSSGGWRKHLSQGIFSISSVAAGFLAIVGVLVLVANAAAETLYWGVALPTGAAFLWLFNGAFSFVVCRYDPKHFHKNHVLVDS